MSYFSENKDLYSTVFAALKDIGVKVPKIKNFKSGLPKQDKGTIQLDEEMFGVSLFKQEWTYESDYPLPKFLAISTAYLVKFSKTVGLFRKSGSISRQRNLKIKLRSGENLEGSDPNDVASLLKQWLRELPDPLIPHCLYDLFVRCQNLDREDSITASLLSCLLLPPEHLHSFKHLLCFLKKIAMHSSENKMNEHNLALMIAPNILPSKTQSVGKTCLVELHASVIKLLIKNADRVGEVPQSVLLHYSNLDRRGSELESSTDILDTGPLKLSRKLRTKPVQDLFSGIRKLVGQNIVPGTNLETSTPETSWMSPNISFRPVLPHDTEKTIATALKNENMQVSGMKPKTIGSNHIRKKSFGLLRWKDGKGQNMYRTNSKTKRDLLISISSDLNSDSATDRMNSTFKVPTSSDEPDKRYSKIQFDYDELDYENVATCSSMCNLATVSKEIISSSHTSSLSCSQDSFKDQPKLSFSNHNSVSDRCCDQTNYSNICVDLHRSKSSLVDSRWRYEGKDKSSVIAKVAVMRQSSLIRGKPNTIKNGLPQHLNKNLVPTQSLEISSNKKLINHSKNNTPTVEIAPSIDVSQKFFSEQDLSLILNLGNLNLSPLSAEDSPNGNSKPFARSVSKKSPTPIKGTSCTIKQNKGELPKNVSNHLDSKIPRLKKFLGTNSKNLSEISPDCAFKTPKLRLSSSVRYTGHSRIPVLSKDKLHLSDLSASFNDSCFLTPNKTVFYSPSSITWMSGSKYLSIISPEEINMNKRESIAQILKNQSGHVLEKVHLYNSKSSVSCSTPSIADYNRGRVLRSYSQKQVPNILNNPKSLFVSQSCGTNTKRIRVKNRNRTSQELPCHSSKSSINSELSPNTSHPLKEVTNINFDGKQIPAHNSTPAQTDNYFQKTVTTSHQSSCNTDVSEIKLKRNSFSGCTPSKLSKRVSRSESSPSCRRPGNRLFRLIQESTFNSPYIPLEIHNVTNSSFSPTSPSPYQHVKKTASSLSIQKLKCNEMIDEWQCEF